MTMIIEAAYATIITLVACFLGLANYIYTTMTTYKRVKLHNYLYGDLSFTLSVNF